MSSQLEKKIKRLIRRFDLGALIRQLSALGYEAEDVMFVSNFSWASQASLCEDITFSHNSYPKVKVVLNMGLLGGASSLPTFFIKKMDFGVIDAEAFETYLSFFDHRLLSDFIRFSYPDLDNTWATSLSNYLKLTVLNSSATMAWMLQMLFPGIKIDVRKQPKKIKLYGQNSVLGNARLGRDCLLGSRLTKRIPSYRVLLRVYEIVNAQNMPWPKVIMTKIREILFPVLKKTDIHLSVFLQVYSDNLKAMLSSDSYLGYSSLGQRSDPMLVHLFSGKPRDEN